MADCIFCKMFTGEVETRKVYEDKNVMGIVDIVPLFGQGQCVVMHRRHVGQFYDLDDGELAELFMGVKAVAGRLREAFGVAQVSIFSRGMRISDHCHILVYPSTGEGPMEKMVAAVVAALMLSGISPAQLDEVAEKIRKA